MTSAARHQEFRDRHNERAVLDRALAEVRGGAGRALLIHGEAGVGKSALLEHVVARAAGFRVVRVAGVESEMELPFAGVHQLCAPLLDRRAAIPAPQSEALSVAFGYSAGSTPDRFLVGLAVLSLLAVAAEDRPLLCVADDAQWLDQASVQALTFVSRRLVAEPIGMIFAVRDPVATPVWRGMPALPVGGLSDDDARALLDSAVPGRLDDRVRDRIVAETRGNPLALLELPRGLTAAELAGGFGLPDAQPIANQIERAFARRVRSLRAATRKVLLTAAAEPLGDASLLLRATRLQGLPMNAGAPAEAAGLIDLGSRVRFRHPLVRTAIYRSATPADRRDVHRALAEATDPAADPDRRAWHRAHAAADADEDVAAELVRSADRAQRRGGVAAAAEFLRRATELTPDPATRAVRALAAAEAELRCGAFEVALKLLITADDETAGGPAAEGPGEAHRARVGLMRARIAWAAGHDAAAVRLLLDAGRRLEPLDIELARDTYRDALGAAALAGESAVAAGAGVAEVARAALAAPKPARIRPGDLLLDSMAVARIEGYAAAIPRVAEALRAFRDDDPPAAESQPWLWLAAVAGGDTWDDESWALLTERHVRVAREAGDLSALPLTLNSLATVHLFAGDYPAAASTVAEIQAIGEATGVAMAPYAAVAVAAWRGDLAVANALIERGLADVLARGEDTGGLVANWARAVLLNGNARYPEALAAAGTAAGYPLEFGVVDWARSELIEAAVRCGEPAAAAGAYERLGAKTRATGTDWALGILARAGALLASGDAAEAGYRESIERLGRTRIRTELARGHLLYGEWLRRENRRQEARGELRTAYDMLNAAGAMAFAERARRELGAAGEPAAERAARGSDALTPQEATIARLAASGLTNPEIGGRLFLSPHTVEWHLRKVFAKLGITSRRQLRPADRGSGPAPRERAQEQP